MKPELSIVVSVYNEEKNLQPLLSTIKKDIPTNKEVIFVNDGSIDNSLQIIKQLKNSEETNDTHIKIINFSRNFGHEAAMLAGIHHSTGKFVVCMDADLQHPPAVAYQMYKAAIEKQKEIILAKRIESKEPGIIKRINTWLFYKFINLISPFKFEPNVSDFFLISEKVKDIIKEKFTERKLFLRGIIQNIGFDKDYVKYKAEKRFAGNSTYSLSKLYILSIEAIISYSKTPLYLSVYIGLGFGLLAFIVAIYSIIMKFVGNTPPGYTTIVVFVSLMSSILFLVLGIMGIYIGYILEEQKKRPIYIVKEFIE
jgi:glycosyltransferase involved in cell wall biosynthesis